MVLVMVTRTMTMTMTMIMTTKPTTTKTTKTIPSDILPTTFRPDLVLIKRSETKIKFLELTCSFEKYIETANIKKKENKY